MTKDPMLATLLDLDVELGLEHGLLVGGGYGLFLKQLHLQNHPEIRTLFDLEQFPSARTTEDIDLILRAEIVTDSTSMKAIREALDRLGFVVIKDAKFTQFTRQVGQGWVKIDLISAPLGALSSKVAKDARRVKPRPSVNLHASKLEDALAVERHPFPIPVAGILTSSQPHNTTIYVPQAFSYLLMKLFAFRDRLSDPDKNLGRHHTLDIYRIVGLLTLDEDEIVRGLAREFSEDPRLKSARKVVTEHFIQPAGTGRLRIREHSLYNRAMDLDRLATELRELLGENQ